MTKKQINNILIWTSAILLIVLIMTPGLWVVITAFRPQVDIMAKPAVWIPRNLSFNQFETMLFGGSEGSMGRSKVPVLSYLRNSLIISLVSTSIAVFIGTLGGYAFARHNFKGKDATHGNSISHRTPGSTGQCQFPGRVFKGKKMAGHMGDEMVTRKNLQIVKIDSEKKLILVKGSVPGFNGRLVELTQSAKRKKGAN